MITLLRLGRREAWRHKARSTLVLLLILIPVALSSAALVLVPAMSDELRMSSEVGAAQARVMTIGGASTPVDLPWADPSAGDDVRVLDAATFTAWVPVGDDGLVTGIGSEQVDAVDPMIAPKYSALAGRLPEASGEVSLDRSSMRRFGLAVGDTIRFALPAVDLTVVGVVDDDDCTDCPLAVLAPGSVERPVPPSEDDPFPAEWTSVAWQDAWYLDGVSPSVLERMELQSLGGVGWAISSRDRVDTSGDDPDVARAWTVTGAAFLLLWTGLVAASGLAVGARRRKRELGLLAASGADPSKLRLAVVAEGLVLGALGAALGVAIGAVVARTIEPSVRVDTLPRALPVPWAWLLVVWAVGTLAAVIAAWSASVGVASLTPSQLLRGHRPTPRPAPAWFAAGLVLFVVGCVVLRVGREMIGETYGASRGNQVVIACGVLAATLGVVAVVVGATRIAGRLTSSAPNSTRLAGRDLARHGVRIAAATAAVAITLTGATATATYFRANVDDEPAWPLDGGSDAMVTGGPERVALLHGRESRLVDGRVLPLEVDDRVTSALAEVAPTVGTVALHPASEAVRRCVDGFPDAQGGATPEQCDPVTVSVADEGMLDVLPPPVAETLSDGGIISNGATIRDAAGVELDTEVVSLGLWSNSGGMSGSMSGAGLLMTATTADALGVDRSQIVATEAFVVLDGASDGAVERVVQDLGFGLSEGSWEPNSELGWSNAVIFALGASAVALVTLLIVMITLALVRVESRSDDDVLLIAGASPGLSRRVSAARAGLIVVAAALPASIAGWSVARSLMIGSAPVPWAAIGLALVALPLIAASMGWLFHRPPRRLRLQ